MYISVVLQFRGKYTIYYENKIYFRIFFKNFFLLFKFCGIVDFQKYNHRIWYDEKLMDISS